jgi:hypothetical protein
VPQSKQTDCRLKDKFGEQEKNFMLSEWHAGQIIPFVLPLFNFRGYNIEGWVSAFFFVIIEASIFMKTYR